jgi:hypothetical protein
MMNKGNYKKGDLWGSIGLGDQTECHSCQGAGKLLCKLCEGVGKINTDKKKIEPYSFISPAG